MYKVGIVGATGYTGIELIRLLKTHRFCDITFISSNQYNQAKISEVYPHIDGLDHLTLSKFEPNHLPAVDVLFLALPHGHSQKWMPEIAHTTSIKVIDLSADFRIQDPALYQKFYKTDHQHPDLLPSFSYGLPEIHRVAIREKQFCANPGCYATSIILGLYPLIKEKEISLPIICESKSGVSGAGKALEERLLFNEISGSISAYATGTHRHIAELVQELQTNLFFSPILVPMTRGILSTIYIPNSALKIKESELRDIYQNYYANEGFIKMMPQHKFPHTKYVVGSNQCLLNLFVNPENDMIVIHSMIDNLIKGAAGQAIQNMNIMLNIDESLGIAHGPSYI